jgi:hypothetical protein
MAYTKLFSSIVTSTIWTEDDRTRIVWITMLAISDKNGEIQASVPGLARIAGVPVEACRAAIAKFLSPDPDSRTKDDGGRRIEEIAGGWALLNFQKYREMASKEESKASEAIRKARYRAKVARNNVPKCPVGVPPVSTENPDIADLESDSNPSYSKLQREKLDQNPDSEEAVVAQFKHLLRDAMLNDGGKWRNRYRKNRGKTLRVLRACQSDLVEGKVPRSWAAYAEDLWKRFAD